MALKDHTTDSAKLSEEMIEGIINGLVKYDPNNLTIHLLPKTHNFSAEKKILLFLVALRGWSFIVKDTSLSDASPTEIEKNTGVRGGTVRPILRSLVQSKMLIDHKGRYEMPAHNLIHAKDIINKSEAVTFANDPFGSFFGPQRIEKPAKNKPKMRGKKGKPLLGEKFNELLQKKWFKGGKTASDLKVRLDEMTVFPPVVQLPFHLLQACRKGLLTREKEEVDGKNVWVYYQQ